MTGALASGEPAVLGILPDPARPSTPTRSPRHAVRGPCGHRCGAPFPAGVLEGRSRQRVGQSERLPRTQRVARW
jgi:hypothetical protein